MRPHQSQTPDEATDFLHRKIKDKNFFSKKDAEKIKYFLKNINKHRCYKDSLRCVYQHLPRRKTLNEAEKGILSLLAKNREIIGIPTLSHSLSIGDI
jgi:hypothetical protein